MKTRMMAAVIILFSLLIGSHTFASFSGHWHGKGTAYDSTGWQSSCENIFYSLEQTQETLNIMSGGAKCGPLEKSVVPFSVHIKNGKLYYGDKEVGQITESTIHAEYKETLFFLHLTV